MTDNVQVFQYFGAADILEARMYQLGNERVWLFNETHSWSSDVSTNALDEMDIVGKAIEYDKTFFLIEHMLATSFVTMRKGGSVTCNIMGDSARTVKEVYDSICTLLPISEVNNDGPNVPVTFWVLGHNGPYSVRRKIDVPWWEEVSANYSTKVRDQLSHLMGDNFQPAHGGQLLLLQGPPGTGKTFALRALASEWREWCDVHFIVDPDKFFGTDASYMLHVLLRSSEDEDEEEKVPWKLLILEDSGELLSADASERSGQGLSRLLNVVDGMVGQGLKILILITTNEQMDKLHEAVSRPGRAASQIMFDSLSAKESQAWARANNITIESRHHSLAELFAIRDNFQNMAAVNKTEIGFKSHANNH